MMIEEMRARLQQSLKPKRYEHSLRVYETALTMAEHFHADKQKVALAALLHDCGRQVPKDARPGGTGVRQAHVDRPLPRRGQILGDVPGHAPVDLLDPARVPAVGDVGPQGLALQVHKGSADVHHAHRSASSFFCRRMSLP